MPQMYRPGGLRKMFRSVEEGESAGFYPSFNEMAKAQRGEAPQAAPVPPQDDEPAPEPPAPEAAQENAPPAPPAAEDAAKETPRRPCPDLNLDQVREIAEANGLDVSVHHMSLRAQVEAILKEQGSVTE